MDTLHWVKPESFLKIFGSYKETFKFKMSEIIKKTSKVVNFDPILMFCTLNVSGSASFCGI